METIKQNRTKKCENCKKTLKRTKKHQKDRCENENPEFTNMNFSIANLEQAVEICKFKSNIFRIYN